MVLRRFLTLSKEILELKAVSKSYPEVKGREILALDNISLKLNSKNLSMVIGPMGSGKSTLLRIAGLLESPSSGSVIFANEDFTNPTPQERVNLIRNEMGFVPPYPSLLPYLTILENVMLPMIKNNKSMAVEMLKNLGVESMRLYPNQISIEEEQKASIARALINNPQIILVDEPTSSLSQSSTINIMEILKNLKKEHTVLTFTDDRELFKYSDVVYKLNKGVLE
ncbi:MAG: ABC-type antimicrobial peptide transport system, ATPase component [Methanobacterium sp. Maddingley MBC34]|nr:MAG: ABC-type antimicrobial peptide transport system, ATPase component [Methanobacterium sp. Maddingley MBC34]